MNRVIRPLDLAGVETLLDWAASEGWNPGRDDALPFHSADPRGFLGAFVDGVMVAGISAVAYDDHFGFIGLYICRPDCRGQGHGRAVWEAGMARLGDRTIGLDGVPEQQASYRSMGFVADYETVRLSGSIGEERRDEVRPVREDDIPAIVALDARAFPAPRPDFLDHWLVEPRHAAVVATTSGIEGYAVRRDCRDGCKIGPVFAGSADEAEALIVSLGTGQGLVQIDVPAPKSALVDRLKARGFAPGFTTSRMYRGAPPPIEKALVFGVTSLELG